MGAFFFGLLCLLGGFWAGYAYKERTNVWATTDIMFAGLRQYILRQMTWSRGAFGRETPYDYIRLTKHIEKELAEIRTTPNDPEEWADVVILAIEGAWRTGASGTEFAEILNLKYHKNAARKWPIPSDPTQPIEHDRTGE